MTHRADRFFPRFLICAALTSVSALASPIAGSLQLGGSFSIGATFLNFCNTAFPCSSAPGNWNIPGTGTGDLLPPYGNDPNGGMIANLTSVDEPVGTLLPGHGVLFLTFTPSAALPTPDIEFYLTQVFGGVGGTASCASAAAAGQTCTPAGSSMTLLNGAGGNSSATITMQGLARRISTDEFSDLQIIFTSQFNTPFQDVLAALASGGTVSNTFAASFTSHVQTVPEPVASLLVGCGLLALGFLHRHRRG